MPLDPRQRAFEILLDIFAGRCDRVATAIDRTPFTDARERGFCRELVLGTLRHGSLYAALAERHLRQQGQHPVALITCLSLACHQIFALDRIPAHAIGDTTGRVLRTAGQPHLVGVANAVVRKLVADRVTANGREETAPWCHVSAEALPRDPARRYGLPVAFLTDVGARLDAAGIGPARLNQLPHLCTRSLPDTAGVDPETPGILRVEGDRVWWDDPEAALQGPVRAGTALVQDAAQQQAVLFAEPRPGERVLDLCAAPGGKALQLRDQGCQVIAADRSRRKVARLTRVKGLTVLVQDGTQPALSGGFDLVVVDAPCSNSGVFARRPEAKIRYRPEVLQSLYCLQRQLLSAAATLVAPTGRLLYTTCSLAPAENDQLVAAVPGWLVKRDRWSWPDPWQGGGYAAVLVRA